MVDINTELVATIEAATSLPVYFELMTQEREEAAITYRTIDNSDLLLGDTLEYSVLRFEIKIWSRHLSTNMTAFAAMDEALKAMGFTRYFAEDRTFNSQFITITRYVATGYKR